MLNIVLTLIVIILFYSVILLLGNISERIRDLKGEALDYTKLSATNARYFTIYGILFFVSLIVFSIVLKYAEMPEAASNVGIEIDNNFMITSVITGIVFVITHIALFYFVWKYNSGRVKKATFFAHSNKLEIIWTTVPSLTMAILVVMGLKTWFNIFPNSKTQPANQMKIEVTAKQFNWMIRYPGKDGVFGKRVMSKDYVSPDNELGIDWNDPASHDDFFASELYMVKDRPVYFNLGAQDVLHSFYLPHFRLKMDCVPGVPTGIGFTPTKTNDETRDLLKNNKYWSSINPETNEPRYKDFTYELACAELCGKSHYGMLTNVKVVPQKDFDAWASKQVPYFETNKDKLLALMPKGNKAVPTPAAPAGDVAEHKNLDMADIAAHGIQEGVTYETEGISFASGSKTLSEPSKKVLDQVAEIMKKNPDEKINLAAHTDGTGDAAKNLTLSKERAQVCKDYLVSKGVDAAKITAEGYGSTKPIASNDTPEGKEKNRRTEFTFN